MSVPSSEFWFSTKIRRNRKSFFLANVLLLLIMALVTAALTFFEVGARPGQIIYFLFFTPFLIAQYFLSAQRLRDFGVTGWLAFLWVPIAIFPQPFSGPVSIVFLLVLISVPGSEGDNRYGPDPLRNQ